MKKLKLLSFIFVFASAGLFAAHIDYPKHKSIRNPVKGNEFGTSETKTTIKSLREKNECMIEIKGYTSAKQYKRNNLNYNNVELLLKDLQTEAVKNSAVVMLNIVSKE